MTFTAMAAAGILLLRFVTRTTDARDSGTVTVAPREAPLATEPEAAMPVIPDRPPNIGVMAEPEPQPAQPEPQPAPPIAPAAPPPAAPPSPPPAPSPAPAPPPPAAPAAPPPDVSVRDEGTFPIRDYDALLAADILPLLARLDVDELETVYARELRGKNRSVILQRIDRYVDDAEAGRKPEPDVISVEHQDSLQHEGRATGGGRRIPLSRYDSLKVADLMPLLPSLTPSQLRTLAQREREGANRKTVLSRIEQLLVESGAANERWPRTGDASSWQ